MSAQSLLTSEPRLSDLDGGSKKEDGFLLMAGDEGSWARVSMVRCERDGLDLTAAHEDMAPA